MLLVLIFSFFSRMAHAQVCPVSPPAGVECVETASSKSITAFSICAAISNAHASNRALMVPIKTSAEWASFRTHPPAGVTVGACGPPTFIFTSSQSWTVPADWNNSNNSVECVGGGGGGASNDVGGGGGGAYAKKTNVTFAAGNTVTVQVFPSAAADSPGGSSQIVYQASTVISADAGKAGTSSGGAKGKVINSIGTVLYDGGVGGSGAGTGAGGGGGAAGPLGSGRTASSAASAGGSGGGGADNGSTSSSASTGAGSNGGNGYAGTGAGAGGASGAGGGAGTLGGGGGGGGLGGNGGNGGNDGQITASVSSGGGGGGAGNGGNGGDGGFGAGGGGAKAGTGGRGGGGFCVIKYTP